jgi:putative SOS response-associated peptidase YedK
MCMDESGDGKQLHAVAQADRALMALASRERVRSFAIITTRANGLCAALRDPMPEIEPV